MKSLPFSTDFRLTAGLGVILIIFAAATLVSMQSIERITDGIDESRSAHIGQKWAQHMQGLLRRQVALVNIADTAEVEAFDRAAENIRDEIGKMLLVLENDEERVRVQSLEEMHNAVSEKFHEEVIPAVESGDSRRAAEGRNECILELIDMDVECEHLGRAMEARYGRAVGRVLQIRSAVILNMVILLMTGVVTALIVAVVLSRSVMKPLRGLMEGTRAISAGDLDTHIEMKRSDEFGELAESFNKMTADLRLHQQKLLQAEKMASLGRLAAGVAHEINNPIGVILGYTSVLMNDPRTPPSIRDELETIDQEARQCKRIVEDLLNLSRPSRVETKPVDAVSVVQTELELAAPEFTRKGCRVENRLGTDPTLVRGDVGRLRQVAKNIIQNALDAMDRGGTLTVTASRAPSSETADAEDPSRAGQVALMFRDSGHGMSEEEQTRAFDPFFSTKQNGTGLGLSICYSIVRALGGEIDIESEPRKGALITVYLSLVEEHKS